jgi:predicted small integral membrane protein
MILRITKRSLVAAVALLHLLVVFNNLTDFDSNYEFVRHVLMMDTTLPGNHGMWRALTSPAWHLAFYLGIIAWELVTTICLAWGGLRLLRALRQPAAKFNAAKSVAIGALLLSLLLWLVAFLTIGGEWFLMWQSHIWNGQDAAFRNFAVVGLVLLILMQPDVDIPSSHPLT